MNRKEGRINDSQLSFARSVLTRRFNCLDPSQEQPGLVALVLRKAKSINCNEKSVDVH